MIIRLKLKDLWQKGSPMRKIFNCQAYKSRNLPILLMTLNLQDASQHLLTLSDLKQITVCLDPLVDPLTMNLFHSIMIKLLAHNTLLCKVFVRMKSCTKIIRILITNGLKRRTHLISVISYRGSHLRRVNWLMVPTKHGSLLLTRSIKVST